MPDPKALKAGDQVRVVAVPASDLREYELHGFNPDTVAVLKWMVGRTFEVVSVDEFHPWVGFEMPGADGKSEYHMMALMDTESWEHA